VRALLTGMSAAEVDRLDMTSLLRRLIEAGTVVKGVAAAGRWVEVDSGEDLELYERLIDRGELTLVQGTEPRA
jgi:NDP-sugar pyrophosphorylase family protein